MRYHLPARGEQTKRGSGTVTCGFHGRHRKTTGLQYYIDYNIERSVYGLTLSVVHAYVIKNNLNNTINGSPSRYRSPIIGFRCLHCKSYLPPLFKKINQYINLWYYLFVNFVLTL